MNELAPDTLAILGTVAGSAIALFLGLLGLATMAWRMTSRLDARIDSERAAADADRRAFQAAQEDFRKEMQRLAERQSRVEGRMNPAE